MQRCDNASVGVIATDELGRYLMLMRARPPAGVAPVAGHIDDHGSPTEAAAAEVREEVGLQVVESTQLTARWRPNVCRRTSPGRVGHYWTVYRARVTGRLRPSREETLGAGWYTRAELGRLADRTAAYAHGRIGEADWQTRPGIEPVWCQWLVVAGAITMSRSDLAAVEQIAAGHRPHQPRGQR
jgi:8-oxo-dGTP pyrophosphatase MutT (NUDIX family)